MTADDIRKSKEDAGGASLPFEGGLPAEATLPGPVVCTGFFGPSDERGLGFEASWPGPAEGGSGVFVAASFDPIER